MKREAFRHPKTFDLAARLGLPNAYAFAHVCYLLNAAADIAPQGDVGKWPDGVIARSAEWTGDVDLFVQSMIGAGWLDTHPTARLLIHDWPDHAERFVKAKLARDRQWFHWSYYVDGQREWDAPDGIAFFIPPHTEPTTERSTESPAEPSPPCDQTKPNQTNPNQSKEGAAVPPLKPEEVPVPESLRSDSFLAACIAWFAMRRRKRRSLRPEYVANQYKRLLPLGPDRAAACLKYSTDNEYDGVFPEKFSNANNGKIRPGSQPAKSGNRGF